MRKKAIILALFIGIIGQSCSRKTVPKDSASTPKGGELKPWTYNVIMQRKLTAGQVRSIKFYNSSEINISGEFFEPSTYVENGVLVTNDSLINEQKKIPRLTVGSITTILGDYEQMNVSFSRKDITYTLNFIRTGTAIGGDYIYVLEAGGGGTIDRNGKTYNITAQAVDCYLLFEHKHQIIKVKVKEKAEGDAP